ncbi:hypothetical protein [Actinomadura fibrosa]|uniref:Glycosyltransferase n=1 Tax=Actinomadura fibrosa TaxID=111802 RepID=A0ABW2XAA0_9ACTN|nr:hypothetical protein [Actinomadura fibrosa]
MNAVRHLDTLGGELAARGHRVALRYGPPALLRVSHPALPVLGESVAVRPGPDGLPWFAASTGVLLAPCSDVPEAARKVVDGLAPFVAASTAPVRPGRWGRLFSRSGM